jgi:hypothetical protein
MLSPERLLDNLKRKEVQHDDLGVYWYRVDSNRSLYAGTLAKLADEKGVPLVIIVVEDHAFENANAVLSDLRRLLEQNRDQVETKFKLGLEAPFRIVLLGRTPFPLPQAASIMVLPYWFPALAGRTVQAAIEDLTYSIDGPLTAAEARIGEIQEALYRVEIGLVTRLTERLTDRPATVKTLFNSMKFDNGPAENPGEFLEAARKAGKRVSSARSFRYSDERGKCLIACLIRSVSATQPNDLGAMGKALVIALGLDTDRRWVERKESLVTLLCRSTRALSDESAKSGRDLLVAIYAASQLATAAAHSASYPRYSLELLTSVSSHLIDNLVWFAEQLE